MKRTNLPPRKSMRVLSWLGLFCWLATIATVGIYAWSWKSMRWPPDYRWMLGTFGSLVFFGLLCFLLGFVHILRGPRRIAAIAGMLIGSLPVILFAFLFAELYWRATTRQTIERGWFVEPVAYLASDIGDGEAMLRKLRRIPGVQCILIDDATLADPSSVLAQMDEHIDRMCNLLGTRPSKIPYWVRYPLIGERGRSMIGWALCDTVAVESANDLTYLDKHEMAHAIMTLTCSPDSNPPTVLGEGWAETQSNNVALMCQTLVDARKNDLDFPTWQEIIQPQWYSRSYGPVYTIGGPVVGFLLEKYDGTTLQKLFNEARQATFEQDFERVYGKSWDDMSPEFEAWLATKVRAETAEENSAAVDISIQDRISLADDVSKSDWEELWSNMMPFHDTRSNPVHATGFRVAMETEDASGTANRDSIESWRVFVSDDEFLYTRENIEGSQAGGITPEKSISAERKASESRRTARQITLRSEIQSLSDFIKNVLIQAWMMGDLVQILETNMGSHGKATIDVLTKDAETGILKLQASGKSSDGKPFVLEAKIDPHQNWRCVQLVSTLDEARIEQALVYKQSQDDWIIHESTIVYMQGSKSETKTVRTFSPLTDREVLSLRDEVLSIAIKPFANGFDVPLWLVLVRYVTFAWAGIGILFSMLVKLFRI